MSAFSTANAAIVMAVATLLTACATYRPLALPSRVGTARVQDVRIKRSSLPTRDLAVHRFDPRDGLDETETAMLAVADNPQLRVLRDDAGIGHAEAFAAGLLPDPQLSFSQDFVTGGSGGPGATSPFGLGIAYDVGSLLTRSTREAAARWNEKQVDLNLLWAEWQTVAEARLLFARVQSLGQTVARLRREAVVMTHLEPPIRTALAAGHLAYPQAAAGLNAAADVRRQATAAQVALDQSRHALRLLLGLNANAPLRLTGAARLIAPSPAEVRSVLADLPDRRPDLLALKAGYRSQDAKLRETILAQFPAINVGFNRARDNAGVYTSGFAISLSLPLFNRNRGQIAVARATRRRLRDDYAARLLLARSDIDRLQRQLQLDLAALPATAAHARRLNRAVDAAQASWQAGELDLPTYLSLRSGALSAQLDAIALRENAAETGVALQALLGADWTHAARSEMRPLQARASGDRR